MKKNAFRQVLYKRYGLIKSDNSYPSVLLEKWICGEHVRIVLISGLKSMDTEGRSRWLENPVEIILHGGVNWALIEVARKKYLDLEASLEEVQ